MGIKDYRPEKITDGGGFEVIKARDLKCRVSSSMIEDIDGGISERDGEAYEAYTRLKYELEVVEGPYKGRRLWRSFNLSSTKLDKNGKAPVHKLLDIFFTAGIEDASIGSDDPIQYVQDIRIMNEQFASKILKVSAWGFKPADSDEERQVHKITGVFEGEEAQVETGGAPF